MFESAVRLRGAGRKLYAQRGKSGLRKAGCLLTASEGDFKESATENNRRKVRMKRRGKSSPTLQ